MLMVLLVQKKKVLESRYLLDVEVLLPSRHIYWQIAGEATIFHLPYQSGKRHM